MREMKDSGIIWMGKIPKHWKIGKVKFVANFYNGDRGKNYPSGEDLVDEGIPFLTSNNIHGTELDCSSQISKYITDDRYSILGGAKVQIGDIIYCLRGSVGNCAINHSIDKGTVASSLVDIRTTKASPEFLNFYLNSNANSIQVMEYMNGSCAANLSAENVSNFIFIEPPLEEQHAIAVFLDRKCAEIDALTADIETQIETLEQYKRSVITEAVTKGLDPNAEMKDSGIQEMGLIKSDFNVVKLKYLFGEGEDALKVGPFGSALKNKTLEDGEYKVYNQAHLINGDFSLNRHFLDKTTFDELIAYEVKPGDILFTMMGTIGKCRVMPDGFPGGIMDSHLLKARLTNCVIPEFFVYVYDKDNSNIIYSQLLKLSNGTIMNGLNSSIVKNLYCPLPSIDEQKEIVAYLNQKSREINDIIATKRTQLGTLEEYKKSLIYEYVTGKKEAPTA